MFYISRCFVGLGCLSAADDRPAVHEGCENGSGVVSGAVAAPPLTLQFGKNMF
jgi:hypothetical protein